MLRACSHRPAGIPIFISLIIVGGLLLLSGEALGAAAVKVVVATVSEHENFIIDSIEVENRNIYDTEDPRYGSLLFRLANSLHIVSRRNVVERELLFATGEPFSTEMADETARNLRARLPINDAWVETELLTDGRLLVRVVTIDQWSLIGGLKSIDHEGNETNYQFGVEERNLLGRATSVSFDWFVREKDPNYIASSVEDPHLFGHPYRFRFRYRGNPDNRLTHLTLGHPFYNLSQTVSYELSVADANVRSERFLDGLLIANWRSRADVAGGRIDYRWGPLYRKTKVALTYNYLNERTSERALYGTTYFSAADFPIDSIYHRIGVELSQRWQSFIVERRINRFTYSEDITLGARLGVSYARAMQPSFTDYLYDLATATLEYSSRVGSSIFAAGWEGKLWFRAGDYQRRRQLYSLRYYNNGLSFVTLAVRSTLVVDKSNGDNRLNLGGKSGLRGYDTEFVSGDRLHVVNLEGRFFPGLELLSVGLGTAIFTDLGRVWAAGEPGAISGYYNSVGLGLRLSLEKLTRTELVRVDFARIRGGNWEISAGSSQYF